MSSDCLAEFDKALSDDLNISKGLAVCFDFIREVNKVSDMNSTEAGALLDTINKIDSVLGVLETTDKEVPDKIKKLAEKRREARLNKDWQLADATRSEISAEGWIVEDTPDGNYRIKPREEV